jgi:hypothetical protein
MIRMFLPFYYLALFSPLHASPAFTDTACAFRFELNMTKAIQDGFFDPDSDQVFVTFTESFPEQTLLKSPHHVYEGFLTQGIDSGMTIHFRFRINDTVYENNLREAVAVPGTTILRAWWNDEYLNTTTFRMDASGFPFYYLFDPATDGIQITGDMNSWQPENLQRIGTSLVYEITSHLDPSVIYAYRFRIVGDTLINESLGGIDRLYLPPDTVIEAPQYFNNRDTRKISLTLRCNMNIQEQLGSFDPDSDFLDVAGSFNDWGAWDLLYDPWMNGNYQAILLFDTALIGGPPLEFKFRINGSWETAELQGLDPRSYTLLPYDTTSNPNVFNCWFDNLGPVVLMPPWATDLHIQGHLWAKNVVTGSYLYHNISGIPEGNSLYRWYRADSAGAPLIAIDSAWLINYTLDSAQDVGKYLVFEVTPVAAYGDSATGQPARVWTPTPIGGVGIPEYVQDQFTLFPNPANEVIQCRSLIPVEWIEIYNAFGALALQSGIHGKRQFQIDISDLKPGFYIFRVYIDDVHSGSRRFIRQ